MLGQVPRLGGGHSHGAQESEPVRVGNHGVSDGLHHPGGRLPAAQAQGRAAIEDAGTSAASARANSIEEADPLEDGDVVRDVSLVDVQFTCEIADRHRLPQRQGDPMSSRVSHCFPLRCRLEFASVDEVVHVRKRQESFVESQEVADARGMTNDSPTGAPADLFIALAALVDEHYILVDLATEYAHRIREHADALGCAMPNIDATNTALHRLVPDRHLSLRRPTASAAAQHRGAPPAGGINRVEHLDDGVCVVAIHPVFTGPAQALAYLRAAAQLVAGAESLVLDLRRCYGGDTDTAALIHGWLLGPEPVRIGRFEHRGRPSTDYTSDPSLGWHFRGPVRVLTSSTTFSGGEDLAYVLQALGRARIVGEQTAGGAHPVEHFRLPGGQMCQIPVARSVIDATGTNWEAIGVTPDTTCSAQTALDLAIAELTAQVAYPK